MGRSVRKNIFSHESHVSVEHHRTLDLCRLEYFKTSRMRQFSNMFHTSHEYRVSVARFGTRSVLSDCASR